MAFSLFQRFSAGLRKANPFLFSNRVTRAQANAEAARSAAHRAELDYKENIHRLGAVQKRIKEITVHWAKPKTVDELQELQKLARDLTKQDKLLLKKHMKTNQAAYLSEEKFRLLNERR